jgi:hypothetical protein
VISEAEWEEFIKKNSHYEDRLKDWPCPKCKGDTWPALRPSFLLRSCNHCRLLCYEEPQK